MNVAECMKSCTAARVRVARRTAGHIKAARKATAPSVMGTAESPCATNVTSVSRRAKPGVEVQLAVGAYSCSVRIVMVGRI